MTSHNHYPASAAWELPGSGRHLRTRGDSRRSDRLRLGHDDRRFGGREPYGRPEGRRGYAARGFDFKQAFDERFGPRKERPADRRARQRYGRFDYGSGPGFASGPDFGRDSTFGRGRGFDCRSGSDMGPERGFERRDEQQADRRSRRRSGAPDSRFNRRSDSGHRAERSIGSEEPQSGRRTRRGFDRRDEQQADRRSRRRSCALDFGAGSPLDYRDAFDSRIERGFDRRNERHADRRSQRGSTAPDSRFDRRDQRDLAPSGRGHHPGRRAEHETDRHTHRHHGPRPFGPDRDASVPDSTRRAPTARRQRDDRPDRARRSDRPSRRRESSNPRANPEPRTNPRPTEPLAGPHRALQNLTHACLAALTTGNPTHREQAHTILTAARHHLHTLATPEA
jgi:hypothetical protein